MMDKSITSNQHLQPVPISQVQITDNFWSPRIENNRKRTIPFLFTLFKKEGRIEAFKLDWKPGMEPIPQTGGDSDIAKLIEAVSYSIMTHPDSKLEAELDDVITLISLAQQQDGYLNPHYTVVEPGNRWTDLRDGHELYAAGHLIEAGVAHFLATHKHSLLDVACRYADHIANTFGPNPGQIRGYCGHEEIELALVRLYRVTGNIRYLNLASFFINERGNQPHYFELETQKRLTPSIFEEYFRNQGIQGQDLKTYNQSHLPVREQTEVVGHAVRAMYLYSAMADLAMELNDETLFAACQSLWRNLCEKKLYITGGIGSTSRNEGFSVDYDLPNLSAYSETCASVGLILWSHRMLQLNCDSQYADVLERTLFNAFLSGVSFDGTKFFYDNPLASRGEKHRQEWFAVTCCPPNVARLLASLGQYIYSFSPTDLAIHLFIQSTVTVNIGEIIVQVHQTTNYPWEGSISVDIDPEEDVEFTLRIRLPGWCRNITMQINNVDADHNSILQNGYVCLNRAWKKGDKVEMSLEMPIERQYSHPSVSENLGCVALQRGPIVYCLEETDLQASPDQVLLPRQEKLSCVYHSNQLGGVSIISGLAEVLCTEDWKNKLYQTIPPKSKPIQLKAIPYYAWDERLPGGMTVWIRES